MPRTLARENFTSACRRAISLSMLKVTIKFVLTFWFPWRRRIHEWKDKTLDARPQALPKNEGVIINVELASSYLLVVEHWYQTITVSLLIDFLRSFCLNSLHHSSSRSLYNTHLIDGQCWHPVLPTLVFFRVIEAILHWICCLKGIKICRYELDNVMALIHFFEPVMDFFMDWKFSP